MSKRITATLTLSLPRRDDQNGGGHCRSYIAIRPPSARRRNSRPINTGWGMALAGAEDGMAVANVHELWIDVHGLRRPARCEYVDPAQKQLVWRGVATKTSIPRRNGEERENITKAVAKLLKKLPPKPKVSRFSSARQFRSVAPQTAIEKRFLEIHP